MSAFRHKIVLDKNTPVVEKTPLRQYLRQTSEKICQIKQINTEIRLKVNARKIGLLNILQLSFYLRFTYFGYVSK